jgi:hypothetical protein
LKNNGSWYFSTFREKRPTMEIFVVMGENKTEMLKAMKEGIENEKSGNGILIPHKQLNISAEYTMKIMKEAQIKSL